MFEVEWGEGGSSAAPARPAGTRGACGCRAGCRSGPSAAGRAGRGCGCRAELLSFPPSPTEGASFQADGLARSRSRALQLMAGPCGLARGHIQRRRKCLVRRHVGRGPQSCRLRLPRFASLRRHASGNRPLTVKSGRRRFSLPAHANSASSPVFPVRPARSCVPPPCSTAVARGVTVIMAGAGPLIGEGAARVGPAAGQEPGPTDSRRARAAWCEVLRRPAQDLRGLSPR